MRTNAGTHLGGQPLDIIGRDLVDDALEALLALLLLGVVTQRLAREEVVAGAVQRGERAGRAARHAATAAGRRRGWPPPARAVGSKGARHRGLFGNLERWKLTRHWQHPLWPAHAQGGGTVGATVERPGCW